MEGLTDKVVVFAGAGGIATAAAQYLGAGGAKVVVGDISLASAERAASACIASGGSAEPTMTDISDEADVEALIQLALNTYGRIDGLFNVAANIGAEEVARDTTVVDIDLAAWQRNLDINLTGYLLTARYAIPHLIEGGGGSIVNTISDAVYGGMQTSVAYQATKAGVTALTRHIARTYGKQGVRSNSVSPGLVLTEMTRQNLSQELQDQTLAITPSHRHGEPANLGAMVAFLLSDLGGWITGQVINVDGGVVMRA
ncbi:SDR family oxidoreductase [Herbiconiux sp. 11R-BC]|uniref:SDR family NAD(P)-dependent oxidoreductase n=1 Tax=Herbiconiux sp. 11R-BC TaxID=3111637 RepID=UPI003C03C2E5